jgi:hypothetical protein
MQQDLHADGRNGDPRRYHYARRGRRGSLSINGGQRRCRVATPLAPLALELGVGGATVLGLPEPTLP